MKLFQGRLDFSSISPQTLFEADRLEKELLAILPSALWSFAEMASEKVLAAGDDADAASERASIPQQDRMAIARRRAEDYLSTAPADDLRAIRRYIWSKLREYAVTASPANPSLN